jgi:hypothetical protein
LTKPPRTLGISLAIIAGVFLFSCLPLMQATIWLSLYGSPIEFVQPTEESQSAPSIVGASIEDATATPLVIQAALGIVFLVIAGLAWRGKPASIRFIFVGAVILLAAGNLTLLFTLLSAPQATPQTGMDSGGDLARTLSLSQLCVSLVIPAYIVWYMSRGPARAFFRGRYLEQPESTPANKG